MSMPLPTRLKKPAKFSIIQSMMNRGYVFSDGCHPYAADFYRGGTTRQQIKDRSEQPILRLTFSQVEQINEWAQSEDDCISAALSFHQTGALPDPMQERVEASMKKLTETYEARIRDLEKKLAENKVAAEKAEDDKLVAAEAAEAEKKKKAKAAATS